MSAQSIAHIPTIRLSGGETIPLEFHKVRVVQRLTLAPAAGRVAAIRKAGFNTFLLPTSAVFLDMLTDSGTNAMSDAQSAAMSLADEAYAGSASFERLEAAVREVLGKGLVLPVHQGRAAEHIICSSLVEPGSVVPMNYHFTTTRAHVELAGGSIAELIDPAALDPAAEEPFKGNMDVSRLEELLSGAAGARVPFVRMEASANLIGGQPFSLANLRAVSRAAKSRGVPLVLDASLLAENVLLIKRREEGCGGKSIAELFLECCSLADLVYFSARKLSSSRGGAIATDDPALFARMRDLVPLFEGFLTYGGISLRDVESMAVGLRESLDETVIGQSPAFIEHLARRLDAAGVPVVLPPGALGVHVDARAFLPGLRAADYPAGALAAAFYIASGVRGMERGAISAGRDESGREVPADMELLRLAFPRRVFTLSQLRYAEDRLEWLFANRGLVGGLRFVEEPSTLRFFTGRLDAVGDWPERLAAAFRAEFGEEV